MKKVFVVLAFVILGCYEQDYVENDEMICEELIPEITDVSVDHCEECRLVRVFDCMDFTEDFELDCENFEERFCTVLIH